MSIILWYRSIPSSNRSTFPLVVYCRAIKNVQVPTAISVFADEIYAAPKSWTEKAYPKLIFFNRHDKGGHFAAWEQPASLTADLRAAFKTLR